jgi:5-(carboxyamino)imidazole ribonucleotide mutase
MSSQVLILLGSHSDQKLTEKGLNFLKETGIHHSLRIASAHRSFFFLHDIVKKFEQEDGKVVICVAGKSAHLGGVVAAITTKPVLCVPVYNPETSGLDSLLSMSQMPGGIPTATMGFGNSGFLNACLQATQILALNSPELEQKMQNYRKILEENVRQSDSEHHILFEAKRHGDSY